MGSQAELKRILLRIDGRGYKAYKDIEGVYSFRDYTLHVDHAQGDPFATPSRVRVRVPQGRAKFPPDTYKNKSRREALGDYLTRAFAESIRRFSKGVRGTGKSGLIEIDRPGQEILRRTSVLVDQGWVEARFLVGLPASGRTVLGRQAVEIFFEEVPAIVRSALLFQSQDRAKLYGHIEVAEDQDHLRSQLDDLGLVAFVANGSVLPRVSGVDDRPLSKGLVVPFQPPQSLEVEMGLPNYGLIKGMGVPKGVTLIVGGGYHGKSTLLNAIERGIYNHIPGDGREYVVAHWDTVKIRAEDGRRIEKVNINPFINHLPFGKQTEPFSTDDASGSTSQAANIMEVLEMEAKLLLIDEDTSATNFMIRDHRMQELVAKDKEPITPFLDKVRQLYDQKGVSTILVLGGSGDYFDVAETVIMMDEYLPRDVSVAAKSIAQKYKAEREMEGGENFGNITPRIPIADSLDPSRGRRRVKIEAKGLFSIQFGRNTIDLSAVEQLVDRSQTRAIGSALQYAKRKYMDGKRTLREIIETVVRDVEEKGLDVLDSKPMGDYALPRKFEIAAAINRLRTLRVK